MLLFPNLMPMSEWFGSLCRFIKYRYYKCGGMAEWPATNPSEASGSIHGALEQILI
jgi:hypothetical protein